MKLLLDTHAFLWFVWKHARLSTLARSLMLDPKNTIFLSMASCWEIAVKTSIGKLSLAEPYSVFVPREIAANGLLLLPIEMSHISTVATLPLHHRDPFDRLLIAQSMTERMPLVSADPLFDRYGVTRLW